jgi:hypothetical protein
VISCLARYGDKTKPLFAVVDLEDYKLGNGSDVRSCSWAELNFHQYSVHYALI